MPRWWVWASTIFASPCAEEVEETKEVPLPPPVEESLPPPVPEPVEREPPDLPETGPLQALDTWKPRTSRSARARLQPDHPHFAHKGIGDPPRRDPAPEDLRALQQLQGGRWLLSRRTHARIYAAEGDFQRTFGGRTTPDGAWTQHQVQVGQTGCTGDPAFETRLFRLSRDRISRVREAVSVDGTRLLWSELGSSTSGRLPLPEPCEGRDHAWWTPDGARMACANEWGLGVYASNGEQLAQWVSKQRAFTPLGASWSADGSALLLFDRHGKLLLWDGADVRWRHALRGPGPAILTDDGSLVVAWQPDRFVFLDAADGAVLSDPSSPRRPDPASKLGDFDPRPERVEEPVRECLQRGSGSVRLATTDPVQVAVSEGGCFAGVAAGGALWVVDLSRQQATLLGQHLDGGTHLDFAGDLLRFSPTPERTLGSSAPKPSATWSPHTGFRSTLGPWDSSLRPAGVDNRARPWIGGRRNGKTWRVTPNGRLTPIAKPTPHPTHERTLTENHAHVLVSDEDGPLCMAPRRSRAVLSDSGRYLAARRDNGGGIEVVDVDQCRVVREPLSPLPAATDRRQHHVDSEGTVVDGTEFTWDGTRLRWSRD